MDNTAPTKPGPWFDPIALLRRGYDWVIASAVRPAGVWVLAAVAFFESSFLPFPADILQTALSVARPRRSFWYAAVNAGASTAGGLLAYMLGAYFMTTVGTWMLHLYGAEAVFDRVRDAYVSNDAMTVFVAAASPLPYKIFALAAGAVTLDIPRFMMASLAGRVLKFFVLAIPLFIWGERFKVWIDRHFRTLTMLLIALVIGVLLVLRLYGG